MSLPSPDRAVVSSAGAVPTPVLELKDVTFRRGGKQILQGVTFTVREGERWALLGPNGAGKSTVLSFCGAVTFPTSGTVCVLGGQIPVPAWGAGLVAGRAAGTRGAGGAPPLDRPRDPAAPAAPPAHRPRG